MDKRVFQLVYDHEVPEDVVKNVADAANAAIGREHYLIVLPDTFSLNQLTLSNLYEFRGMIDHAIDSILEANKVSDEEVSQDPDTESEDVSDNN